MTRKEFNNAVTSYSGRLNRYLIKCLRNEEDANDLVQESFERLWKNRKKVSFEKAKSWLFTTAHNLMINFVKKKKAVLMDDFGSFEPHTSSVQKFEMQDLIEHALSDLSNTQRQIILLRDLEGYNYKEIGEILMLNESQVKVYLFRARKKVKQKLKDVNALVA